MNERSIQEQIVKYLADIHSIEQQALVQMKIAPKIAGDATLEAAFEKHIRSMSSSSTSMPTSRRSTFRSSTPTPAQAGRRWRRESRAPTSPPSSTSC
jgi:hypothetical protein